MKVTHVRYGRLASRPNFENERVEREVEVRTGEYASQDIDYARKFVDEQLNVQHQPSESHVEQEVARKLREVAAQVEQEMVPC